MAGSCSNELKEVTKAMRKLAAGYGEAAGWYYNSTLPHLGRAPVPEQRKRLRTGYSFSELDHAEQAVIWDYIWQNSSHFEVSSQAIMYFESLKLKLTFKDWKFLKEWTPRIDNWAHSDGLSNLYATLHEHHQDKIYPVFQKWNISSHLWERRQSIVGLFYYSSLRKNNVPAYKKVIDLLLPLIEDEEYYVQKGVGWTIRETFNVYPERVYGFLEKNAAKLHPAAWQAATEKLSPEAKNNLKMLRSARKSDYSRSKGK